MKTSQLFLTFVCAFGALSFSAAHAQAAMDHSKMGAMPMAAPASKPASVAMTDGEVKKIDAKAQTVTLKHGPIQNLAMPAMTMGFKLSSPALMGKLKVGDKVRFTAEAPNDVLTLVTIELAK